MDKAQIEKAVTEGVREVLTVIRREEHAISRQDLFDGMVSALIFWLALLSVERSLARRGASITRMSPELEELLVSRSNRIREAAVTLG